MLAGEGLWEIKMEAGVQPLPQDFCERRKSGTGSALAKKKKGRRALLRSGAALPWQQASPARQIHVSPIPHTRTGKLIAA